MRISSLRIDRIEDSVSFRGLRRIQVSGLSQAVAWHLVGYADKRLFSGLWVDRTRVEEYCGRLEGTKANYTLLENARADT